MATTEYFIKQTLTVKWSVCLWWLFHESNQDNSVSACSVISSLSKPWGGFHQWKRRGSRALLIFLRVWCKWCLSTCQVSVAQLPAACWRWAVRSLLVAGTKWCLHFISKCWTCQISSHWLDPALLRNREALCDPCICNWILWKNMSLWYF